MMKKLFLTVFFYLFLPHFQNSFAWGREGHQLVADIAKSMLNESVKGNIQKYLGNISFEEAAIWMDEIRSDNQYDYMKTWHYINIEKGGSYIPGTGDNIIDRLNITYNELQHKQTLPTQTITTDILILFHLTGDLFQPLHVGYGSDKGGNTYQVSVNGKGTNLHHVWDSDIIEEEHIGLNDCLALYKTLSLAQKVKIQNTDFVGWLNENRKLLDAMYPTTHKIDNAYLNKNKNIVITQLLYSGMKLASILESLFLVPDTRIVVAVPEPKAEKITVEDATKYIGRKVVICSMVYGVKELASVNFINVGAKYPDNPLTIVVFKGDKGNFKNGLGVYENKTVCVTGTIKEYKGKPEIIITKPEDISIQ
ncbi:MAG: S1/P1 nuclease [Ferruginibacter sp.]